MSYSHVSKCGNAETFLDEAGQACGRYREECRLVKREKAETHSSAERAEEAHNIDT